MGFYDFDAGDKFIGWLDGVWYEILERRSSPTWDYFDVQTVNEVAIPTHIHEGPGKWHVEYRQGYKWLIVHGDYIEACLEDMRTGKLTGG